MRVASICARAGVVLREEGLRSFWFKVLGETVYRRMVVMELLVPLERRPTGPPVAGAVLRLVRQDDLDAYADLRGGHAEARKALALGERCLGTWLDGRLLTTHWFADRVARIEPLDRTIPLEHGEAYVHGVFVAAHARRGGLGRYATVAVAAALEDEGFRRMVAVFDPENVAGRRLAERSGYRIVGTLGCVKLGPWRRDFGSLD